MSSTLNQTQAPSAPKPHLTIRPSSHWSALNLHEVWQFRDLLMTLAARDVKLRYRQTAMGAAWVVLQPLLAALVFSFLFNKVARLPTGTIPPFVFTFAGLMAWNAFAGTLAKASGALVGNAHLVSKVFFPRLVLPLSTLFSTLIDFGVTLVIMLALMGFYHVTPDWHIVLLPIWIFALLTLAMGIGLVAAAVTVQYRDVGFILPVLTQYLQYASPVAYATAVVTAHLGPRWTAVYFLNPIVSLLEAFRWSLLGTGDVHWGYVIYAVIISVVILVLGAFQFKRMERKFADVI